MAGTIVCRNADGAPERIRQLEADRDAVRAEVAEEIAQAIERKHVDAMAQYRMERSTYWEGSTDAYDTAARIARQIGGACSRCHLYALLTDGPCPDCRAEQ